MGYDVSLVDGHIDEPKMTDEEIIKALECCCGTAHDSCRNCPYDDIGCEDKLEKDALDLINRQKAEIEKLSNCVVMQENLIQEQVLAGERIAKMIIADGEIKAEAIKEFMAKAKCFGYYIDYPKEHRVIDEDDLDNLVKEMEELWKVIEQ